MERQILVGFGTVNPLCYIVNKSCPISASIPRTKLFQNCSKIVSTDLVVRGALKLPPSVYMMPNIGLDLEIYVISNGRVLEHLLDPELENKLPIIPNEVSHVNFTWKSGAKKYFYNFFRLKSFDETILKTPTITIKKEGRVPKQPKGKNFDVYFFLRIIHYIKV